MLAGFALSPKLWMSSRFYPLTPVWSVFKPLASPADYIVFFTVTALLIAAAIVPRREILIALFVLLGWLVLQDQSRLQPWFYQYALMLLAIALAGPKRPAAALNTCCLIVAATYIWSGLAKLNPNFIGDTFPFLVRPFIGEGQLVGHWLVRVLAFAAALLECAAGIGLLIKRFRPLAVSLAITMHVFILVTIGPLGRGVNDVVWPWNVAMIAFLLVLFFRRTDNPAPRDIIWGRGFAYQKIVLVLFAVMPMLSFFNLWDHYLSSALYSGNRNSGVVYLSDAAFDRLPDKIEDYVTEEDPNRNKLDIFDWSVGELNVPSYPEIRVYKNVARQICDYASNDPGVELVVQGKLALVNSNRRWVYHCSELRRTPLD
jgi:uncharacterized membrane protein YphA (DoxX/SURF4 family)